MIHEVNISKAKVEQMLANLESEQIERTTSTRDTDKFAQAVCAFSNDLANTARNGYLLIGVNDNGSLSGLKATDDFLQSLGGLRSDGNILPQPIISASSFSFPGGDVVVLEVQPSPFPPVRYKGRTWIRVGPRKAVASEMEERILIERRSANVSTFDIRPCLDAGLNDIQSDLFKQQYLPLAIDKDLLANDKRETKEQLAALRFYNTQFKLLTYAGILLFGVNPEYFLPGAYIQYVRFKGKNMGGEILNEKKFSGNLLRILKQIESFIDDAIITQRPVPESTLREKTQKNFPNWAIRELMMNAVMHRDYESNAPIKFYHFDDRIEISNAGGLYGKARPENFPDENDYRNPVLAEAMKILGYVNRFNRGIARVQQELTENGNSKARFDVKNLTAFKVTVMNALSSEDTSEKNEEKDSEKNRKKTKEKTRVKTGVKTRVKTREKIINLIRNDNSITIEQLVAQTGLSRRGIEWNIDVLKKNGILERKGSKKTGIWMVNTVE